MFANFIYFILALLIYTTYQPSEQSSFSSLETLLAVILLMAGFSALCRHLFHRVALLAALGRQYEADHRFSTLMTRHSILALAVFALIIHGLSAPSLLTGLGLFDAIPTLLALVFLGLFIGLLVVLWSHAWTAHRRLYDPQATRGEYVSSNLRFSLPVVLPWLLISGISDVLFALPFEGPKRFLSSTEGEAIYFLVFLLLASIFAPVLVQRFWGCRPLEHGYYRSRIEALCRRAGVRYRNILYWPIFGGRMLTAGVMGLARRFRYILVTESLLKTLTPEEVDTVIAHEIGHVKRYHLIYYMVFIAGFMLISYAVFDLVLWAIISARPVYRLVTDMGFNQTTVVSTLFGLVFLVAFLFYFRIVFGYFMRNFERQADTFVYSLFSSAMPMVSTFEKIAASSGQSADKPNWHHFSIRERIQFLLRCEQDRRWIDRHNRKVRRSLAAYLVAMAVIGVAGYQLNFGAAGAAVNGRFIEHILMREIEHSPNDASLYSMLGDLRYSQNDREGARAAYEASLRLDPKNAQVLNNLAWLLATAKPDDRKDPKRALDLALQSVALDPTAHALDTLAESYFVNNDVEAAVSTAAQALERARENRTYYLEQLERFKKMLGKGKRAI